MFRISIPPFLSVDRESTCSRSSTQIVIGPSFGSLEVTPHLCAARPLTLSEPSLVTIAFAPIMRVLRPAGAGDPCSQWNSAVNPFAAFAKADKDHPAPQWTCTSEGSESVNGRAAHKWGVTSNDPKDGPMTIWVDDRLHVLSRSTDKNGGMEMRNISEGPQPDSLFTPPANYKKLSLTSMLGGLLGGSKDSGSTGASSTNFLKKLQGAPSH